MNKKSEQVRRFHALHESGCFVIPNPWDVGSARALVQMGFRALATTSCGFAWSQGHADNHITLESALAHFRSLAESVDVPINADFEDGFGAQPEVVGRNVAAAVETGIAGLSIEDSRRDPANPLYEFELAVERMRAARAAIDESGTGVLLVGRSEGFVAGRRDIAETIRRLQAYAEAGADCLYAPGLRTEQDIKAVVNAVAPKPVNVGVGSDFTTVAQLGEWGVRRISVGGGLARIAWAGFLAAAREIAQQGTFTTLKYAAQGSELNQLFVE